MATVEESGAVSYACEGLNPHYKPPLQRWRQVEIIGRPGMEFGVVMDEIGFLGIVVRLKGEPWPESMVPKPELTNLLKPGEVSYVVEADDCAPAVGHEFQADPQNPGKCLVCSADVPEIR